MPSTIRTNRHIFGFERLAFETASAGLLDDGILMMTRRRVSTRDREGSVWIEDDSRRSLCCAAVVS